MLSKWLNRDNSDAGTQMIANLGNFIEDKASALPNEIDLQGFLDLALTIANHDSLAVSIPVLNLWTKILKSEVLGKSDAVLPFTPQLLNLATSRLIRVLRITPF